MKIHSINWVIKSFILFFLSIFLLNLSGCASNSKERVFGEDMPTMKEIHDKKFNNQVGLEPKDIDREVMDGDKGLQGDSKKEYINLSDSFEYLPNPVMVMYIYKHLTTAGTPVQGYSTYFKFYEKDHFSLPGEINIKEAAE